MNLSLLLYSTFLVAVTAAAATNLTSIISQVPTCALSCLIATFESSPAILADPSITCTNVTLQEQLSACIQGVCTYAEQEQIGAVNNDLCAGKPIESRQSELYVSGYVLCIMSFVAILLRCYYRYSFGNAIGYDDWAILAAGVVLVGELTTNTLNVSNGFGTHYWNIDPHKIPKLLRVFYVAEILYVVVLALTKMSILFFYLRVFPGSRIRMATWCVMGFVVVTGLTFALIITFQCHPLAGVFDTSLNPTCLNINLVAYTSGGFSIGQDVIILLLPIPELSRLNMNLRKKLNLLFMFSIGGLACITSIIRLKFIVTFGNSTDPTWDNVTPSVWSLIEINVGIVCACLPTMRALCARWLPVLFDYGNSHYEYTPDTSASKHPQRSKPLDLTNNSNNSKISKTTNNSKGSKNTFLQQPATPSSITTVAEEMLAIIEGKFSQANVEQAYQGGSKRARGSRGDGNLIIMTDRNVDDGLNTDPRTGRVGVRRAEDGLSTDPRTGRVAVRRADDTPRGENFSNPIPARKDWC